MKIMMMSLFCCNISVYYLYFDVKSRALNARFTCVLTQLLYSAERSGELVFEAATPFFARLGGAAELSNR